MGSTIHHSKKISATLGDREGSHDVHMHMSKTAGRRFKNLNRVAGVFFHFGGLTCQAVAGRPSGQTEQALGTENMQASSIERSKTQ